MEKFSFPQEIEHYEKKIYDLKFALMDEISRALKTDKIDIVIKISQSGDAGFYRSERGSYLIQKTPEALYDE